MSVKNSYPSLPELAYKRTSVEMPVVVSFAKGLVAKYNKETVRTAYCIFRNESANGKSGVCNNYGGIQADVGPWKGLSMSNVVGTCIKIDNNLERRRFLCFNENGYQTCFDFTCYKVYQRGIFIGGKGVNNPDDLAMAYELHWVDNASENTEDARNNFKSLYKSSIIAIP